MGWVAAHGLFPDVLPQLGQEALRDQQGTSAATETRTACRAQWAMLGRLCLPTGEGLAGPGVAAEQRGTQRSVAEAAQLPVRASQACQRNDGAGPYPGLPITDQLDFPDPRHPARRQPEFMGFIRARHLITLAEDAHLESRVSEPAQQARQRPPVPYHPALRPW